MRFLVTNPFYHSRIWHHLTSSCMIFWHHRSVPILIAHCIVKNKGTSTLSRCAQLYSTRAIRRALDVVWIPTKWKITGLLRPWSFLSKFSTVQWGHLANDHNKGYQYCIQHNHSVTGSQLKLRFLCQQKKLAFCNSRMQLLALWRLYVSREPHSPPTLLL